MRNLLGTLKIRYFIVLIVFIAVVYLAPSILGGYSWSEQSAINNIPYQNGEIVFKKNYGKNTVVITDTGNQKHVKLIKNPWGPFHKSTINNDIEALSLDQKMKFDWTASKQSEDIYDAVFAVEILTDEIVKVIVSNEYPSEKDMMLNDVKEKSSIYIEMDVENNLAVHYSKLPFSSVGSFNLRGVDDKGKIVSLE